MCLNAGSSRRLHSSTVRFWRRREQGALSDLAVLLRNAQWQVPVQCAGTWDSASLAEGQPRAPEARQS